VYLGSGSTGINTDISQDGQQHLHDYHLQDHIPETEAYDVALRVTKDGNLPQIQFNDDAVWHDFAPVGGTALKAGPWFPYLQLDGDDLLSDHRVDRPRATKSAGKTKTAPAASDDGAGAAADGCVEAAPPPQKKARRDEAGGSE
jgi:hypothetical protein